MSLAALLALTLWCAALSWFDLRHRRLPNALTGAGALAILGFAYGTGRLTAAVIGGLLLSGVYLLAHLCVPRALGAGDVKLALGLGAATAQSGAAPWVAAALIGPVLTAGAGVALLAARRPGCELPHGPSMCAAGLFALVCVPP